MWSLCVLAPASRIAQTNKHKHVNECLTLSPKHSSFSPTDLTPLMTFSSFTIPLFFLSLWPLAASREFRRLPSPPSSSPLLFSPSDQSITPNCSMTLRKVKDGEDGSDKESARGGRECTSRPHSSKITTQTGNSSPRTQNCAFVRTLAEPWLDMTTYTNLAM